MACTGLLAPGFQLVTVPLPASLAAIPSRVCPPTWLKLPPAYTVDPRVAIAFTLPSVPGFQSLIAPVSASIAAMWFRVNAPTLVNVPPRQTLDPVTARAPAWLLSFGLQGEARPDVASSAATPARGWPQI